MWSAGLSGVASPCRRTARRIWSGCWHGRRCSARWQQKDLAEHMDDLAIAHVPFWYLRHGETDWNRQGLSQGNIDIPLNELGLAQAREAAQKLRNRGITSIVASPLSRPRVTAEIVAEALGLDVMIERDLREVSW